MAVTRRRLLYCSTALPLGATLLPGCGGPSADRCADPELLGAGEAQLRRTLEYTDTSGEAAQQCAGCQFFGKPSDGCGHCEILDGAVSSGGWCNSWAAAG